MTGDNWFWKVKQSKTVEELAENVSEALGEIADDIFYQLEKWLGNKVSSEIEDKFNSIDYDLEGMDDRMLLLDERVSTLEDKLDGGQGG